MRRILIITIGIACALFPVQSFAVDEIKNKLLLCSKIEENSDRIKCYDELAKQIPVDEEKENWHVSREESKINKTKTIVYRSESTNKASNSIGIPESASLILRCHDNETDAYIVWPAYLGSLDSIDVTYRIDENSAVKERWNPSSGGTSAFSRKPIDFIQKISTAKTIIFKIAPHSKTASEVEFNITGAEEALKEISRACGWEKNVKKPAKK